MTMPQPHGRLGDGLHGLEVQIERRFPLPSKDVWAALTESPRLEQWIGRWEGNPSTGKVAFYMTAEGTDVAPEEFTITQCQPPHAFAADTRAGQSTWHLRFELSESEGTTTLVFAQALGEDPSGSIGPGWEYYLDRLAATLEGRSADAVDWEDYYPGLQGYYQGLAE